MTWSEKYPNFTQKEIQCDCCGKVDVDEGSMEKLQELRDFVDRPLTINSAVRCTSHNLSVGGGARSQHLSGRAFDIDLHNFTDEERLELVALAKQVGFTGFGYYDNFIHIDTGTKRKWGTPWQ